MVFSAPEFLFLFMPIVCILYYIVRKPVLQNGLLIVASLFFYAWGEPRYVLLMVASIVVNYLFTRLLTRKPTKTIVGLASVFNVGMLFVFKYAGLPVRIPIGISFYTFQALSLVIDVYRDRRAGENTQVTFWDVLLYISFFPQLIAGPIVQYKDIRPYLRGRSVDLESIFHGIRRFVVGLSKKVLLADTVAVVCDGLYAQGDGEISGFAVWVAAICYLFQIYFDFSGYSDMAIGLGEMLGFHFKENFNMPYTASSVRDFWRRWHISLSTWFRDYVYIPLGGNRKGKMRTVVNRMTVFALTGIWHGAGLNFLLWGLWHGLFVSVEEFVPASKSVLRSVVGRIYTCLVVLVGFVLFRAETLGKAGKMLALMFTDFSFSASALSGALRHLTPFVLVILAVCVVVSVWKPKFALPAGLSNLLTLLLLLLCIMTVASATYSPFIYFRF